MKLISLYLLILLFVTDSAFAQLAAPLKPLDPVRVNVIVQNMSAVPHGLGVPCSNRDFWNAQLATGKYNTFLNGMKKYTFPSFSEDDYFSLSNGTASSSSRGLTMMRKRAEGLSRVTWAECLENKGTYMNMLEAGLRDILQQPSWVSPRNDTGFRNYHGIEYSVELTSALYAHTIAQCLYLLGDKISAQLRQDAVNALYLRVFNPTMMTIDTQNPNTMNKFLTMTNNYNPVCLAGVVGAALTVIPGKSERAVFAHIGEYYSKNGLAGFGEDGYCTEGITYFNYGFGNYLVLREIIFQETQGSIDLFDDTKVNNIAWYAPHIEMINEVYPPFSDCSLGTKPTTSILYYLSRNLGMGMTAYDTLRFEGSVANITTAIMMVSPNSASQKNPATSSNAYWLRSFFSQSGVLVGRPEKESTCRIALACKSGHNAEHHNHNDIGSYVIVSGEQLMAGDQGSIAYAADIFSACCRYNYKLVGSYGHPVPLLAGKEQRSGAAAKGITTFTSFTDEKETFAFDFTSAYDVPSLKKIIRLFQYDRTGNGSILIADTVSYTGNQTFETAIITQAAWQYIAPDIYLKAKGEIMKVTLGSSHDLSVKSEIITEGGKTCTRIGIYTVNPVKDAWISLNFRPSAPSVPNRYHVSSKGDDLFNGDADTPLKSIAEATARIQAKASGVILLSAGDTLDGGVEITLGKQIELIGNGAVVQLADSKRKAVNSRAFYVDSDCRFSLHNLTIRNAYQKDFEGGGVYSLGELSVDSCLFIDNVGRSGGAIYSRGSLFVDHCLFRGNVSENGNGGAIRQSTDAAHEKVVIQNSTFVADSTLSLLSGGVGSAVQIQSVIAGGKTDATLVNCTFAENHASRASGGTLTVGNSNSDLGISSVYIVNNTFYGNNESSFRIQSRRDSIYLINNAVVGGSCGLTASYSIAEGRLPVNAWNNIILAPVPKQESIDDVCFDAGKETFGNILLYSGDYSPAGLAETLSGESFVPYLPIVSPSSLLIDAGTDSKVIHQQERVLASDACGKARVGKKDVGAYESDFVPNFLPKESLTAYHILLTENAIVIQGDENIPVSLAIVDYTGKTQLSHNFCGRYVILRRRLPETALLIVLTDGSRVLTKKIINKNK
jgi:predicted outer membrane repeat protein